MTQPLDLAQFDGHTPPPWTFEPCDQTQYAIRHRLDAKSAVRIATIHWQGDKSEEKNARLVAAAPALLAKARRLREEKKTDFINLQATGKRANDLLRDNVRLRAANAALAEALTEAYLALERLSGALRPNSLVGDEAKDEASKARAALAAHKEG
jgi:uncharacterized protein (DUF1778 family)